MPVFLVIASEQQTEFRVAFAFKTDFFYAM